MHYGKLRKSSHMTGSKKVSKIFYLKKGSRLEKIIPLGGNMKL